MSNVQKKVINEYIKKPKLFLFLLFRPDLILRRNFHPPRPKRTARGRVRKAMPKKWKEMKSIMMTYKTNNIKEDCLLDELQKSFTFWSKLLHGWVQEPHWRAVVCYFSNIFQYLYDLFNIILGWRSLHYLRYRFGFGVL